MGTGAGVFMLASGATLAFAVQDRINGVDLSVVGWILMAAGLVSVALTLAMRQRRSTHTVVSQTGEPIPAGAGITRQERREDAMV